MHWIAVPLSFALAAPFAEPSKQVTANVASPTSGVHASVWMPVPAGVVGLAFPALPPKLLSPPRIDSLFASFEREGMPTFLNADGVDDGTIVLWEWDFEGDGVFDHASGVGPGVFFVYPAQGQYQAKLRATDDVGLRDLAVVSVNVAPPSAETVTDADGNVYQTVTIGSQTWMIENLKTTSFNDGTPIVENDGFGGWNTTFGQYQWADTRDLSNYYDPMLPVDFYGAAYNEAALASGKLAPSGWRIPSEQDWLELVAFLAGDGFAGIESAALKTSFGWNSFSGNGLDAYGFRGLPGGYVSSFGGATGAPVIATWATTEATATRRLVVNLLDNASVLFAENSTLLGATVRCIKE